MATRQPKLPDYQLRKLPNYGAYIGQVTAAGVGAMNKLGERNKKREEERDKLIKEGDAIELNMVNLFNSQKKSSINQMDSTNRAWAQGVAGDLNTLYQKAYGSNGTKEDRNNYKEANAEAIEKLNQLGIYANMVGENNKAINTDIKAREIGTNVGRLTKNSMYGDAEKQYQVASQMNKGATNMQTFNGENGHLMISYNLLDPEDPSKLQLDENDKPIVITDDIFTATNIFGKTGQNLSSYAITEEQNLNDKGYAMFKKDILDRDLLNTTGLTEIVTRYNKNTNKYTKRKVIKREGFINQLNSGDENSQKLNTALNTALTTSDFNTQFFQLNAEGYNTDGSGKTLPLTDLPWKIGNKLSPQELADIQTVHDDRSASPQGNTTPNEYTIDGQTVTDPTPDGKLTREDLNTIQSESAKMMLVDFYSNLSPEGTEEQMRTDRFDYEKKEDGSYTPGQRGKFDAHRDTYNAIVTHSEGGGNKFGGIYNYENGEPTTNKLGTLKEYANYLNNINSTVAGGGGKAAIVYKTGEEINADPTGPDDKDPDKIYKVTMGSGGKISHINTSNFNKGDLSLTADIFYGNVMGEYNMDHELQTYLSKPIKNK